MPLTDEQKAAVTAFGEAVKGVSDEKDVKDLASQLKTTHNALWTVIRDEGHQKATRAAEKTIETAEEARDKALEAKVKAEEAARKAASGNPDVDTVRREAAEEKTRLENEHKANEATLKARIDSVRKGVVKQRLAALLSDPEVGSVRMAWVRNLLRDPKLDERIELAKDSDEDFVVLQAGRKTAIAADEDTPDAMLKAWALEIKGALEKEEPEAIAVKVDDGTGLDPTRSTGGPGEYDPVAEGKRLAAQQAGTPDMIELARR